MTGRKPTDGSVRANDEQPGRLRPLGQGVDEIEGRRVGPLEVLEREHEQRGAATGPDGGHAGDGIHELAEHPIAARGGRDPVERLAIRPPLEGGYLQEPGGRSTAERCDERLALRPAARSP